MTYVAAAVQFEPLLGRPDENVARLLELIEEAAAHGAQLIVLPEMANVGYCFASREEAAPYMQSVPGPFTKTLEGVARRLDCVLAAGLGEVDSASGLFYNTAVLVGPGGYIGKYRKTHFFSADAKWAVEGDLGLPVWDTPLGRLGIEVCMDATYPEAGRLLALQGAQVICFPTNWVGSATPDHRWVSGAFENGVYWVAANRWGEERGLQFTGGSCIIAPNGEMLASLPTGNGIVYGDIDLDRVHQRTFLPEGGDRKLADRQPAAYREMLQTPYTWSPAFFHRLYGAPGLPAPRTSRVAVLQCSRPLADAAAAVEIIQSDAQHDSFDLLVLPALALSSGSTEKIRRHDCLHGVEALHEVAAQCSSLVVSSVVEQVGDERYHTTVLVDGHNVLGKQRARHLMAQERAWSIPGDDAFLPIDTPLGRIGLVTGYDASFFETLRVLATAGADIVCIPACLPWPTDHGTSGEDHVWSYWRSKAWESCTILAFANYSSPTGAGGSGVWFPDVREATSAESIAGERDTDIVALEVDTHSRYVREKRGLGWRRLHWYTPLVLPTDEDSNVTQR